MIMTKFIKGIAASIAMMIPTTSFAVESETLLRSHDWLVEVNYYYDTDSFDCTAAVDSNSGKGYISIGVDHDNFYTLGGVVVGIEDGRRNVDLLFRVGSVDWTLRDANVETHDGFTLFRFGLGYAPDHAKFVGDIMKYSTARLVINNARDEMFSLRGSADAIKALERCRVLLP